VLFLLLLLFSHAVSASEAGQQKRLLLLDSNWQQVGEVPLDLGRRFFTFAAPGTTAPSSRGKTDSIIAAADGSSIESEPAAASTAEGRISDTSDTSDTTDSGQVVFSATGPGGLVSLSPDVIQGLVQQGQLRQGDVVVLRAEEDNEELQAAQKLLHKHGEKSLVGWLVSLCSVVAWWTELPWLHVLHVMKVT
jgi:hypothetical protein